MQKRFVTGLIISLLAQPMLGCTTLPSTTDGFCLAASPVFLDDDEYLADANAQKVMAVDIYGHKHCGWVIPKS